MPSGGVAAVSRGLPVGRYAGRPPLRSPVPRAQAIHLGLDLGRPRLRAHDVPDVEGQADAPAEQVKMGQKKPTPLTHQMPMSMRLTVT